ncbi:anti-anti-sigma factor [Amycolatopsis lexingtonensis]|uniref:Anti-anti-sigma factor n=1 Tax=Amycolatopsis lexingtonensis TaxID=218822 RepID=A0ABR9I4P2_9PSEU|nr:STAS domain-containing protein [Amycolatopsis lexingtonensis]MBE1498179.1 anti-anti-sigma factor [Amycolatopsis lexingtonensis]
MSTSTLEGALVVAAVGTVDLRTASCLSDAVVDAVNRRPATLVVDLTGVDFLAAAGLHVLLGARRAAGEHTRLRVVASGAALRTITLTASDEVLAVYPTLADATES